MITEQRQGHGRWSLRLRDTTPGAVWDVLDPDTAATEIGGFGHIIITPARTDPDRVGDAGMLSLSMYSGIYRGTRRRDELTGVGLVSWLGDNQGKGDIHESAIGSGITSFADWITAALPDSGSITAGSITAIAGSLTESMVYLTPREALDRVMDFFGGEYRVNPDGTLDAGTEANLYATTPEVLLLWRGSDRGANAAIAGIEASRIDVRRDLEDYATRVLVLAQGSGEAIATGAANASATVFKDIKGNAVDIVKIVSSPGTTAANADTVAATAVAQVDTLRRAYKLSTREWGVRALKRSTKRLEPGDSIYVYDPRPDAKMRDTANRVPFEGQIITPIKLRLDTITWPVQEGMGVYFRYYKSSTATWVDLSNHVVYERGATVLDVVAPTGAGPRKLTPGLFSESIRRKASEAQDRLAAPHWQAWTPTYTNITVGNGTVVARYAQDGKTVRVMFDFTLGSTSVVGTQPTVSTPATAASGYTVTRNNVGGGVAVDTGTEVYPGVVRISTIDRFAVLVQDISATYLRDTFITAAIPFTWTTGDILAFSATYEAA